MLVLALAAPAAPARADEAPKDFSPAERALFMTDQFAKLRAPQTLRYQFRRSGSLEPAFTDQVAIALKARSGGGCCDASGEFLSGERKVELPPVEGAKGNPVTLFFLERDVREMQRLTKGQSTYFRKRIRMAIYQGAQQRAVSVRFRGKAIAASEFTIDPYLDDPNRARFEQLAGKRYVFTLSDAVPGGVYAIRSRVNAPGAAADAAPLLAEELLIEGAEPAPPGT
ncbi:MAG TPA: hypothetical protein VNU71_12050 [Burkholderiaceae bacterium]|nr:hypothetical protein [Burkholderiaceae bacterium]